MSILGGGVEFVARDPAQLKKPDQRFFNQVVRTGGAGRDANNSRATRQPVSRNYFRLLVQIIVFDLIARKKPRGVEHKIGRQFFFAHLGEMRCVRAVVAANDKENIHLNVEQLAQSILPFLRRAADRIEEPEILLSKLRSVSIKNGLSNPPLHLFGFTAQHGRLVCNTDRLQMNVRVESGRMRALKFFEESLLVATMP